MQGLRILLPLFCLSGFAALMYEALWAQYLKILLGHAAYAQLLVLVIFMGGMTLGAWLCGRFSERIGNLLRIYALVELGLGIFGLFFHAIFLATNGFLQNILLPNLTNTWIIHGSLWSISALIILPQSILLGATFPLMTGAVVRRLPTHSGKMIALIYFINSLGGALGVLATGYYFIGTSGLPGTSIIAGFMNVGIATVAWFLSKNQENKSAFSFNKSQSNSLWPLGLLLASFITGFSSFAYEIGWIRMLSMVLGSSTHAFELMLSAFIFGLAFGSLFINRFMEKLKSPIKTLGYIQILMGVFALLTLPIYNYLFELMSLLFHSVPKTELGYIVLNVFNQGICFILMLPATFCAGMTLPLLTQILLQKNHGERSIGQIYASNTLGSILGAIAAQQWIMPTLGLKALIGTGSILDIALGIALLWIVVKISHVPLAKTNPSYEKSVMALPKNLVVTLITAFTILFTVGILYGISLNSLKMSSGVFRQGNLLNNNNQVLFYKDGKTSSVSVLRDNQNQNTFIATNGKTDASIGVWGRSTSDEATQILITTIPWSLHTKAKRVAVVGFGSGMTAHTFLTIPTIKEVNTIEIEPAMVEGARQFGDRNHLVYTDPRSKIILEDARTFFLTNHQPYDMIVSEPSNPWVSGVSSLFTDEFYQIASRNLAPDGIFAQWICLYELSPALVSSILTAVGKNFPYYSIYFTDDSNIVVIASKDYKAIEKPSFQVLEIPATKTLLNNVGVNTPDDLIIHKLGNNTYLSPFFKSFDITSNSDYFPVLDVFANKTRFLDNTAKTIIELRYSPLPVLPLLGDKYSIQPERITPTSNFNAAKQATLAAELYGALVEKNNKVPLAPYMRTLYLEFANPSPACSAEQLRFAWIPNLHAIVENTIPFLTQDQMKHLWEKIKSSPCFTSAVNIASTVDKEKPITDSNIAGMVYAAAWINFYDSYVYGRYHDLKRNSEMLFKAPGIALSIKEYHILLGLIMYGSLKTNDYKEAQNYFSKYPSPQMAPMPLRLLAALAYGGK